MKAAILLTLFAITLPAICQSPTCHGKLLQSESDVLNILATSRPSSTNPETRECILGAINYASELHSRAAIPELIRFLSFQKESLGEKQQAFALHLPIEGEDYPAVLALGNIGAPARANLLKVIQSDSASVLERQNATHAIILSFLNEPEHDPGKGIVYLKQAAVGADPAIQSRLNQVISYALTTQACTRFAPKCTDAMKQPLSERPHDPS